MMMTEMYQSPSVLAASMGIQVDDSAIMDHRMELHKQHEERVAHKLKRDMEKMKKKEAEVIKVGLYIPDKTGEQQMMREYQWWDEEMKKREAQRLQQEEKEAQYAAQVNALQSKEQELEQLKNTWQEKREAIRLGEEELQSIQKDFETKLQLQLQERMDSASGSNQQSTMQSRMKAEAERRVIRRNMKQEGVDEEQQSRGKLIQQIDEKNSLEREILRAQKEVGLMRQKLAAQEKSTLQSMDAEKQRRVTDGPKDMPSLEELYAPKVVPPRPDIPRSHNARMQAEAEARAARRAQARAQLSSGSSESGSSSKPGVATN